MEEIVPLVILAPGAALNEMDSFLGQLKLFFDSVCEEMGAQFLDYIVGKALTRDKERDQTIYG